MQKVQKNEVVRESLALVSGVTYAVVPSWYGVTCRNLQMDLIVPKRRAAGKPRPLLIWLCGGAFSVMDKSVWIPELTEYARRGYIVASLEYRTMQESCFPVPVMDIKAGIRYLKAHAEQYLIDSEKIAIAGESAGATLAGLAGMMRDRKYDAGDYLEWSSEVQAVIDFYGISDMQLLKQDKSRLSEEVFLQFLDRGDRQLCHEASLLSHVDKNTPPFLLLHGEQDSTVPIIHSERLYEALEKKGVRTDFYRFPNAGHGDDRFYQEDTVGIADAFLKEVLGISQN